MDAMVDDRFAETLESGHRLAHEVLRNYSFYITSDVDQRVELLRAAHPLRVDDGHLLLEAGYACRDVVLVGRGCIRTYLAGESGREVTLYYVHAGESCPVNLGAAMMGIGAFADACASGELVGATIPALDFRAIGRRNAAVHEYAFSATMLRFGEVIDRVREITMRRIDHRLAEYLLRKFAESAESPPAAEVTQLDIALDLGTAREVVSRRLHELDSAGAVELRRGKIILQDRVALRRVIDPKSAAR